MSLVNVEDHGEIRHLILNRPEKRNAFNGDFVDAVGEALRAAANDTSVRCVVIRGEGKVFSAGMDLLELAAIGQSPEHLREFRNRCILAWNIAEEMTKPTIAQIHGGCFGGAMELALACDLRVIASDATMSIPEVRFGLVPDVGGSSRLPAVVGLGRAKDLVLTGRAVQADEAERIGLVNRVAPPEQLAAATQALIDELLLGFPVPQGLAKRLLDSAAKPALALTLEQEAMAQEVCAATLANTVREAALSAAQ